MEILRKTSTLRVAAFKITLGHRNRYGSIDYLWLPISVTWYGPISYRFRYKNAI